MSGKDGSVCENYACMYYYRLATNAYPHFFGGFFLGPLALLELWGLWQTEVRGRVRDGACVCVCACAFCHQL